MLGLLYTRVHTRSHVCACKHTSTQHTKTKIEPIVCPGPLQIDYQVAAGWIPESKPKQNQVPCFEVGRVNVLRRSAKRKILSADVGEMEDLMTALAITTEERAN